MNRRALWILGAVAIGLTALVLAIVFLPPLSLITTVRVQTVASRLERVVSLRSLDFAQYFGLYIFPYDFFPESTDFGQLRRLTPEEVTQLTPAQRSHYELFELAESLDIRSLRSFKFFPIVVRARAGIDLAGQRLQVVERDGALTLRLPPVTITALQILDQALPEWPDFPFTVELWRRTITVLEPHLRQKLEEEARLLQTARANAHRQITQLLETLGIGPIRVEFDSP